MAATEHARAMKKDSQDFIETATFQLLEQMPLASLTVSKISERAGLSRMAFYRNFETVEQVIEQHYRRELTELFELIKKQSGERFARQLAFFEHFSPELELSVRQGFEPIIQRIFTDEIKSFYSQEEPYLAAFMAAGVYAVWKKWILEGQVVSLARIHDLLASIQSQLISRHGGQAGAK